MHRIQVHASILTHSQSHKHRHTRTYLQVCFDHVYIHCMRLLKSVAYSTYKTRQLNTQENNMYLFFQPSSDLRSSSSRRSVTRRGTCIIEKIICSSLLLSSPKPTGKQSTTFCQDFYLRLALAINNVRHIVLPSRLRWKV